MAEGWTIVRQNHCLIRENLEKMILPTIILPNVQRMDGDRFHSCRFVSNVWCIRQRREIEACAAEKAIA